MTALVIGGHPRSGTTILQIICNYHPRIDLTTECANFSFLGESCEDYRRQLEHLWSTLERRVPAQWQLGAFCDDYLSELARYAGQHIGALQVETVLKQSFPHASVVGDKYPDYVFMLDNLARDPGLKRIVVYRDGRDVVGSVLRKVRTDWKDMAFASRYATAGAVARSWVESIESMSRHAGQLLAVRYEELVEDPWPVARAIGDYLDVDPRRIPIKGIRRDRVGSARKLLSPGEFDDVMQLVEPTLKRLDYL